MARAFLEFSPSGKQRVPAKRRPPRKPPRKKPPVRDPVTKPPVEEPPPLGKSPIREPPDPEANSVAGVPLTHPDRVLFPEERLTPRIRPEQFTVKTLLRRIDGRTKDAWSGMASVRQTITAAMLRSLSNRS